jgi:hypothetical protein
MSESCSPSLRANDRDGYSQSSGWQRLVTRNLYLVLRLSRQREEMRKYSIPVL